MGQTAHRSEQYTYAAAVEEAEAVSFGQATIEHLVLTPLLVLPQVSWLIYSRMGQLTNQFVLPMVLARKASQSHEDGIVLLGGPHNLGTYRLSRI